MSECTIAHVTRSLGSSTESWLYNQLVGMKRCKNVVLTQIWENPSQFPYDSTLITVLPASNSSKIIQKLFKRVGHPQLQYTKATRQHHANVIHGHFGTISYSYALPLAKKHNLPLVTTFYGVDISRVPKQNPKWVKKYQTLFEYGSSFLVEGTAMKDSLQRLGCPESKIVVHHIGVEVEKYPFQSRCIKEDGIVKILMVGRFTEKKGFPYALRAFADVYRNFPNMRLTIIGDASAKSDQAEKQEIQKIIADTQIHDVVDQRGFVPYSSLRDAYYEHHIMLSPSVTAETGDTEGGSPVSITEAVCTGMPVLSTYHCDIPDVVQDGLNGFTVDERDVDSLSSKLHYLIANHQIMWGKMGKWGHQHIHDNYNLQKQLSKQELIYSQLAQVWSKYSP